MFRKTLFTVAALAALGTAALTSTSASAGYYGHSSHDYGYSYSYNYHPYTYHSYSYGTDLRHNLLPIKGPNSIGVSCTSPGRALSGSGGFFGLMVNPTVLIASARPSIGRTAKYLPPSISQLPPFLCLSQRDCAHRRAHSRAANCINRTWRGAFTSRPYPRNPPQRPPAMVR